MDMETFTAAEVTAAVHIALRRHGLRPDGIADLSNLGLTLDQKEARRKTLNASEMPILAKYMADPDGEEAREAVDKLALEKLGRRDFVETHYLNASAGQFIEPWILAQAERELGIDISDRGTVCYAPRREWMRCTLDGLTANYKGGKWVIQTKFLSPFWPAESAFQHYLPQAITESYCADAAGPLLIIYNQGNQLVPYEIEKDPVAMAEYLKVADWFWEAVSKGESPIRTAVRIAAPRGASIATLEKKAKAALRAGEADMTSNNAWATNAADFLAAKAAADKLETAKAALKDLVPEDKKRAFGHGVEITVNAGGAKTVKVLG